MQEGPFVDDVPHGKVRVGVRVRVRVRVGVRVSPTTRGLCIRVLHQP